MTKTAATSTAGVAATPPRRTSHTNATIPTTMPPNEYALAASFVTPVDVVAPHKPSTCRLSVARSSASVPPSTHAQTRVRLNASTTTASTNAPRTAGHGDGPGTHTTSPVTRTGTFPSRSMMTKCCTTCRLPGLRRTLGGSRVPIQCAR